MDAGRFADLMRVLRAAPSRRDIAGVLAGAALSAPVASLREPAQTAAKKKKCKKKRPQPPPPCAALCGVDCEHCLYRADAPPLCGQTVSIHCQTSCAADNDCVGQDGHLYCATRYEARATGRSFNLCDPEICAACAPGVRGHCATLLEACGA